MNSVPDGLGVRIPDSHSGGPGSIPGQGAFFAFESYALIIEQLAGLSPDKSFPSCGPKLKVK